MLDPIRRILGKRKATAVGTVDSAPPLKRGVCGPVRLPEEAKVERPRPETTAEGYRKVLGCRTRGEWARSDLSEKRANGGRIFRADRRSARSMGGFDMPRFRLHDLKTLEIAPTSPGAMRSKVSEMIVNSTLCRAKIESMNPETGEYRIVLQGTLDKEENRFD